MVRTYAADSVSTSLPPDRGAAALTGATAGGLAGAFMDMGIPSSSSRRYEDELRHGHSVVTVQGGDERLQTARRVVQAQGAHDIEVD